MHSCFERAELRRLGRRSWNDRDLESDRAGDGDPLPMRGEPEYAEEAEPSGDWASNLEEEAEEGVLGIMMDDMAAARWW